MSEMEVDREALAKEIAVALEDTETLKQRQALPGRLHQPHWDGMGYPHSWICQVCWDEGNTTGWPCRAATYFGREVAEASGMDFSW